MVFLSLIPGMVTGDSIWKAFIIFMVAVVVTFVALGLRVTDEHYRG